MMKKTYCLLFLLGLPICVLAQQEIITPLERSPVEGKKQQETTSPALQKRAASLSLPFFEDFSNTYLWPDPFKWMDSLVYINNHFPIDPPSLNVATFDGSNGRGIPYVTNNPNATGFADALTSQYINLVYPPGDSVYLSFYFQPTGLGDRVEANDSLILQFRRKSGVWSRIWAVPGSATQPFAQVLIAITDTVYLHDSFQFRFRSWGQLSGNLDHWHLDYIRLDRNRNANDIYYNDIAVSTLPTSLLKDYQSIPYSHFLTNPSGLVASKQEFKLSNRSSVIQNTDFNVRGTDKATGNQVGLHTNTQDLQPMSVSTFSYSPFTVTGLGGNPVAINERVRLIVTGGDVQAVNDTANIEQLFSNYYAYDDGSAEAGYAVRNGPGKVALRFNLLKADTFRGIGFYFNRSADNVIGQSFFATIWKKLTPVGTGHSNNDELIYRQLVDGPIYMDSINFFAYVPFDTLIVLPAGEFYVGWIQNTGFLLNVGWDRNYQVNFAPSVNPNLYYNTLGYWENSLEQGTPMIRPMIGPPIPGKFPFGIPANRQVSPSAAAYPNPAHDYVRMEGFLEGEYQIFDLGGRKLAAGLFVHEISTGNLENGVYLLQVNDAQGNSARQTIMIQHP